MAPVWMPKVKDDKIFTFPEDFLWGAATAAYQIEGAANWAKERCVERVGYFFGGAVVVLATGFGVFFFFFLGGGGSNGLLGNSDSNRSVFFEFGAQI